MRKLLENGTAISPSRSVSGANLSKAVKICGYILFLLGIATLFSVVYYYRFYTQVPTQAAIVSIAELAAGFMQIKCSGQIKFQKLSLIVDFASAATLLIILYLYPDMLKLPAFIGLSALAAAVVISLIRIIKLKK